MHVGTWLIAVMGLALLPSEAGEGLQDQGRRPNFVVILCDDLGYGDLGSYGHPTIQTPNLDRLAAGGLRFTAYYAPSPVCSPSRAGLMTGRTPSRSGVYEWIPLDHPMHLPRRELTIATLLKRAGYATGHFGKWHLNGRFNSPDQPQPDDHGFDHWFSTQNNAHPSHRNPDNFVRNGEPVGELEGFSCQLVTDEFLRWLDGRGNADRPFFAFICFHEPHEPVDSPDDLVALYPDAKKKGEALYYANVTNVDRAVGRIVQGLRNRGVEDNTLVFFTSDNGPETLKRYPDAWRSHGSPGPWRGMKLQLTEGGIRVPAIASWPGRLPAGEVRDQPVGGVDLLPTLCALAGIDPPDDRVLDGESIVPLLWDDTWQRSRPLFWHYVRAVGDDHVAMRDGTWKMLAGLDLPDPREAQEEGPILFVQTRRGTLSQSRLYRLDRDPHEDHDLSLQYPEESARLYETLEAWLAQVRDEAPPWDSSAP